MIKILIFLVPVLLLGQSPFDTPKPTHFDTSSFEGKAKTSNKKASKNKRITCRRVCDKKIYKETAIYQAVSFYKKSNNYKFIDNE